MTQLYPTGASWARSGVWPVWSQNCENLVLTKVIIHCKNKALGSVRQKHEKKSSNSYVFFCRKLISRCSRVHGSAATLTNCRACAQLEEALLGSGLSSSAYGNKNTILGTGPGARGSPRQPGYQVSWTAARDHPTTRASGQHDVK